MSDELEKRLRELLDCMAMQATGGQLWLDELVHRAARIGAELEREACARVAERSLESFAEIMPMDVPDAIRARGGKR